MTGPQTAETTPRSGRRWTSRVLAVLAILGPGLIAANAGNDAGGSSPMPVPAPSSLTKHWF